MAKKKADAGAKASGGAKAESGAKPAKAAGRTKWFDDKSSAPLIEVYARRLESFMQAMADGVVEAKEVEKQEERLVSLMKEVEPLLDDAVHEKVTQLLCELTAYDLMQMLHSMHQARPKTTFHG